MKGIFICLVLAAQIANSFAQPKKDKKLQHQIEALIKGFNGEIGVYVKDIRKNKIVEINADSIFPTASMVKVPILTGLMHKIHNG